MDVSSYVNVRLRIPYLYLIDYFQSITIALIVFGVVSFAVFVVRITSWRRRDRRLYIDFATLIRY